MDSALSAPMPMLAKAPTATSPTLDQVLESADWIVQRKWDGARALFRLDADGTSIRSRTGQDFGPQFPELRDLHLQVPTPCLLDGEIVVVDDQGRDSLEKLQLRIQDKQARRRDEIPVTVVFFDALAVDDRDLTGYALEDRLRALEGVLEGSGFQPPEDVAAVPAEWEGAVAKRRGTTYRFGKRSSEWIKFKVTERATVRATGITKGNGSRSDSFGAVTFADAEGIHRGQVGTGFSDSDIEQVLAWSESGDWPLIEVEYASLSKTGLCIHARYKGVRLDKEQPDSFEPAA